MGGPLDQPEHTLLIKIRAVPMLEGDLGKLGKHGKEGLPIFAGGSCSIRLV